MEQDSKKTPPTVNSIKLTEPERKQLMDSHNFLKKANTDLAKLCVEKEREIRRINYDFDRDYNYLEHSIKSQEESYKNQVQFLSDKYGKEVSFDLVTGEVKPLNPISKNQKTTKTD